MKEIFGVPTVVTLNRYASDTEKEIELAKKLVEPFAKLVINDVWSLGGKGALDLADEVLKECEKEYKLNFAYQLNDTVENKVNDIVCKIYGGKGAKFSDKAQEKLKIIDKLGISDYPVVIAKTQFSLSDDKSKIGAPTDFEVFVDDIEIKNGAKFLVVICGSMLLMPGLSKEPASKNMHIDSNGKISGIY